MLKLDATKAEIDDIMRVIDRLQKAGLGTDRIGVAMDLEAAHSNGCPMRFADMAKGAWKDLLHDVHGIAKNIDRVTGKLKDGWAPRFAA